MQLTCPHCGKQIPSENINIQQLAAVCPACNTVFQFDPSESKRKRRKVKQPPHITAEQTDHQLNIGFRTNFRLDRNETFLSGALLSAIFTFITLILIGTSLSKPVVAPVALGIGLFTLFLYYCLGLMAYNKTHIEVSDEKLIVSRRPLPNVLTQPTTLARSGIENVRYEETAASKKEDYDTPRFNVWAEMVDGHRKLIVGDVIEDYAVFVSQQLNEYLDLTSAPDAVHGYDDDQAADDDDTPIAEELVAHSKSRLT